MSQSRFVFLALPAPAPAAEGASAFGWLLVSANNRLLGRSPGLFADFTAGHDAVVALRRDHERLEGAVLAVRDTARWTWQVRRDGVVVAESSRPYLRMRECRYNLERFLAAVPVSGIVPGVRFPRRGERTSTDPYSEVDSKDREVRSALTSSPTARW